MSSTTPHPLPILLLKSPSPSAPTDPYTLTTIPNSQPTYIPVLTHTLLPDPLITLLLTHFSPASNPNPTPFPYGALIFTSQRSVAAFSTALNAPRLVALKERLKRGFEGVRVYVVGPATERAVRGVGLFGEGNVFGGEGAGSGEAVAGVMLGLQGKGDTGGYYDVREEAGGGEKKPVLFLTGEKRRDIIPRMLMDPALEEGERVRVDELEVYRTGQLEEFEFLFTQTVARVGGEGGMMWVVVFSSTAGEGMLRGLGWLNEGSRRVKACVRDEGRKTFVACIGPTTRDYLVRQFGFEADVVAEKPSPQGVKEGIESFMRERGL